MAALDTYGFTALMRMASNNLPVGAQALLSAEASAVVSVLQSHGPKRVSKPIRRISVFSELRPEVAGTYEVRAASEVPRGFDLVCQQQG